MEQSGARPSDSEEVAQQIAAPSESADWWTIPDIAAYLRVKPKTVTGYRTRGQMIEEDEKIGRTPVWKPARIIAWHQSRPHPGRPGRAPKDTRA